MKKLLILLFFIFLYANGNNSVYDFYFKKIGEYFNIEPKILKIVSVIESNMDNNAVNVNANKKNFRELIGFLKEINVKYIIYHKYYIMFDINHFNYIRIFNFLRKNKYSFDCGLMQINSFHIKSLMELKLMFKYPFYNIYKGAYILRKCFDEGGDNYQVISCYNTGSPYRLNTKYIKRFFDAFYTKK